MRVRRLYHHIERPLFDLCKFYKLCLIIMITLFITTWVMTLTEKKIGEICEKLLFS